MDIAKIRLETPSCLDRIHFNNAGSSLMPQSVSNIISDYAQLVSEKGGYYAQENQADKIQAIYESISELIGCSTSEVALCDSSTVAWQKALLSISFEADDEILTTYSEYSSNYMFLLKLKNEKNIKIVFIDEGTNGDLLLGDLESKINKKTKLISITHMPTGNGVVHPIEKIGEIATKHNILYIVDACQSAGQCPLDIKKIKCDFLSASGRKFIRGPRGTGFLYVSSKVVKKITPPFVDLRSAEWLSPHIYKTREEAIAFETWEKNFSIYLGLGEAIKIINTIGAETIWNRVLEISSYLRSQIKDIDCVELQDRAKLLSGIVTFSIEGESDPSRLINELEEKNIGIGATKKEFTQLEFRQREFSFVYRTSVHYYNTKSEVDAFVNALKSYLNGL